MVYDAEGYLIWPNTFIMNRDPAIFPSPEEFLPHRFLPDRPASFPEVSSNSMRGFEKGPRSCIGQELALVEMRVILVLLIRRFDFKVGYEELDRRLGRKPPNFDIKRAYTVLDTSVKPKDGMPLFISERASS